jgi:hypothetical protein
MNTASMYRTLFQLFLYIKSFVEILVTTGTKVTLRLVDASRPRKYVFFNGYATPYPAHQVKTVAPGVPNVTWTYDLDTNVLTRGTETPLQNVPWLSASISYNGMNLYPLDDFVSSVKYATTGAYHPPPAVIVGAWSLYSGIVLDNQLELDLSVITDEGDVVNFSPWSFETTPRAPQPPVMALENFIVESTSGFRTIHTQLPPLSPVSPLDNLEELDELPPLDNEIT